MSSRDKILARRAKFMAAAIASVGVLGCSEDTAQVCLEPAVDGGGDTRAMPCLEPPVDTGVGDASRDATDTNPMPCLAPQPQDSAVTDSAPDTSVKDTGAPVPCLSMPLPDAGDL